MISFEHAGVGGFGAIDVGARHVPSWNTVCGRVRVAFSSIDTVAKARCYAARFYEGNLAYAQSSAEPARSRHINAANMYSSAYYIPQDNPGNTTAQNVAAMRYSLGRADAVATEALDMPGSRDPDYVAPAKVLVDTHTTPLPMPADATNIAPVAPKAVSMFDLASRLRSRTATTHDAPKQIAVDVNKREPVKPPSVQAGMSTNMKIGIGVAAALTVGAAVVAARKGKKRRRRR